MTISKAPSVSARTASFLAACAIALVSGTPYLYSTYGNQLTTKLALNAVQSNAVSAGVHYGLFLSGPLFGRLVDCRGPKVVGILAAGLLTIGYAGLALTYSGLFYSLGFLTAFTFLILVGMGSQAGYMTAVSTNAHNFQSSRGLAMGVPIACFGLSALLFAQLSNRFFKDDTQGFLFLVSKVIGATILISLFFLNVFPKTDSEAALDPETISPTSSPHHDSDNSEEAEERQRRIQERQPLIQKTSSEDHAGVAPSGFKLFRTSSIAQMLLVSVILLSGPGLMYVTNAGNVIRSIYRSQLADPSVPPTEDELVRLQQLQNYHVSLISLYSCLGRISTGFLSDLGKRGHGQWWGINRIGFMLYAALCVWLGQTFGATVSHIDELAKVSILVGLGYGSVFGVGPAIVSEWFGVSHFGSNWGWISVGNAIGGQAFNLIFGSLYDIEARHEHTLECFGPQCFHTSFVLGSISTFIGVAVLAYLTFVTRRSAV
ncbi:major facilitator superfamily domain-containing protein [Mortierella sp. GBAus27b]|nr:hypothetical protein BGX31_000224 [Mortierella sp. GBA43]KAI8351250.1 major facilitator superfamily domain-containing protein [Mortierella sp. GBAus27b]